MSSKRTFGIGAVVTLTGFATATACGGSSATEITDGTSSSTSTSSSGSSSGRTSTSSSSGSTTSSGGSTTSTSSGGSSGALFDGGKDATSDADASSTCPANITVTSADLDKDPGWNPAAAPTQACTAGEISQFGKNLDDVNLKTWSDLGTGLSTTCANCIITDNTKKNWGPIVVVSGTAGAKGFYNFGACFGRVENEACGRDVQYLEFCIDTQCDDCVSSGDRSQCVSDVGDVGGACASFSKSVQTDCKSLTTSGKKCNNVLDAANTLCGPNADAGM